MDQHGQKAMRTWVSFHTLADGSVQIVATGRNGTLSLNIDGGENGPAMDIPDRDNPDPSKRKRYKAAWGLEANGRLRGWLVADNGKIKWFSEQAQREPRKPPVKGRQEKNGRKEGFAEHLAQGKEG